MDGCAQDVAHGTCLPGGQLHLSFNHTHPLKPQQCVHLQTGLAALCFCPLGGKKVQTGMQSRVLFSLDKWVLKIGHSREDLAKDFNPEREALYNFNAHPNQTLTLHGPNPTPDYQCPAPLNLERNRNPLTL
jgi:hypothetical protein